jgi:hypothetical protein
MACSAGLGFLSQVASRVRETDLRGGEPLNTTEPVTGVLDQCEEAARAGLGAKIKIEDETAFPDPSSLHIAGLSLEACL